MACELFNIPGMGTGFICSSRTRPSKCKFCGAVCTKECDFPSSKRSGTCDAKMCDTCATPGGEEVDYCPDHAPFVFTSAGHRIIVVNIRNAPEGFVYIGREMPSRPASPLGNPFKLADGSRRDEVLARYKSWLWGQMQGDTLVMAELRRLAEQVQIVDVLLACWCVPQTCHGQIVAKAIKWHNEGK